MLLEALIACAGVIFAAVATAMGIALRGGRVRAEGELDFRGTLGQQGSPVGFAIRPPDGELDTGASDEHQLPQLQLSEALPRIYQSLKQPPELSHACRVKIADKTYQAALTQRMIADSLESHTTPGLVKVSAADKTRLDVQVSKCG